MRFAWSVPAAALALVAALAPAARGQDADEIRRQIEELDRKKAELQRQLAEKERAAPAPAPGTAPGRGQAPAAEPGRSGETLLEPTEVVATRFPQARGTSPLPITVIEGRWFEDHQESSLADALRQVPGVTVSRGGVPGSSASVFLRGAGSNQVLVLQDGIPLNDPTVGAQFNFFDFDVLDVERVEVLRGSCGAIYGSDAIGGVISITSRRGRGPGSFRVAAEAGSFGTDREAITGAGGDDAADWSFGAGRTRTDNLRDREEFLSTSFAGRFGARVAGDGRMEFSLRSLDSTAEDPFDFGNPIPNDRNIRRERELLAGGLSFEKPLSRRVTARVRASITDIDSSFRNDGDTTGAVPEFLSTNEATTAALGASARAVLSEANDGRVGAEVVGGFDFEKEESLGFSQSPFGSGGDADRATNNRGFYALATLTRGPATLVAGGRHDDHSQGGKTWSPQAGARYAVEATGTTLRANYGQGFRAPTPVEFADPFVGNRDLRAEESRSFDAGFVQRVCKGVEAEATWFHLRTKDLIAFSGTTFRLENVNRARVVGYEVAVRADLGGGFAARAAYTHQRPRDRVTGAPLANRPEDAGSLGAEWRKDRWTLFSDVTWSGAVADLGVAGPDPGLRRAPGRRVLVDLGARWKVDDRWTVHARVENLLNAAYVESPTAPRALPFGVFAGVSLDF